MLKGKQLKVFRKEVKEALKPIAEKYEANIHAGKIRYNNNRLILDLEMKKNQVNGKPYEQAEFEQSAEIYGYIPEDYGREFVFKEQTYKFIGFNPNARTKPIIGRGIDGKKYRFHKEDVKLI